MVRQEPVGQIVCLELHVVAVGAEGERRGHYAGVVDQAVQRGFMVEDVFGGGDNAGEREVVNMEMRDLQFCAGVLGPDVFDCRVCFGGRACSHVHMGAVPGKMGHGIFPNSRVTTCNYISASCQIRERVWMESHSEGVLFAMKVGRTSYERTHTAFMEMLTYL